LAIYFISPDTEDIPSGGTKQVYRQVDVLNELGYEAYVAHYSKGFKCSWFNHETRSCFLPEIKLKSDDYIVLSELAQMMPTLEGISSVNKVIYNQNFWLTHTGFSANFDLIKGVYEDDCCGVLASSVYIANYLKWVFPGANVQHVQYSFDREPLEYRAPGGKKMCYMPRRRSEESYALLNILCQRGVFDGWEAVKIEGMSAEQTIGVMQESAIFLSFGEKEGFGMPPCEAMACGCAVVGYHGIGGMEFFGEPYCVGALEEDTLDLAKAVESMVTKPFEDIVELGKKASEGIRGKYSSALEVESIKNAWNNILDNNVVEVSTQSPEKKIKVCILHHNSPSHADELFEQLSTGFDDIELIDSGSEPDKIPKHLTLSLPNVYWTGGWEAIFERWSDYDAVWMVGDDIELRSPAVDYRKAIEKALPFGCWSPAVDGRAHEFMLPRNIPEKDSYEVLNLEGMAMAMSGELIRTLGGNFEIDTKGYGQDFWLCYKAREIGLKNIIDSRVEIYHPPELRYNDGEFLQQMNVKFGEAFGYNFRETIFKYINNFHGNLLITDIKKENIPMGTIVTVDNGWGMVEFERITKSFPEARKILMRKGVSVLESNSDIEIIDYQEDLSSLIELADIAIFTRVGAANEDEYVKFLKAGIPVVVNVNYAGQVINHDDHEKSVYLYGNESWAHQWVQVLMIDAPLRHRIGEAAKVRYGGSPEVTPETTPETTHELVELPAVTTMGNNSVEMTFVERSQPLVSVITPTYRRDSKIVKRSIDCLKMQTVDSWEQLVCSDGENEPQIRDLVASVADSRVTYQHTVGKKEGDFGNTVRSEMLKKARGKYILFFDDDNVIMPNYLERMIGALEGNDSDYAVCRVMHFGPLNREVLGDAPQVLRGLPVKLYHTDPLQVLVKREVMQQIGWNTERGYIADGVTLEELGSRFPNYAEVPEVLGVHM